MPWIRYATLATFRKLNPDWRIRVWTTAHDFEPFKMWDTGERQDYYTYCGPDWTPEAEALGIEWREYEPPPGLAVSQAADLCRWDALADGALFLDMDIAFIKPMPLIEVQDAMTVEGGFLYLGMTHGRRGGYFSQVSRVAKEHAELSRYQSCGVEAIYRMLDYPDPCDWHFIQNGDTEQRMRERFPRMGRIPFNSIHALDVYTVFGEPIHPKRLDDAIGVHWYAGGNQQRVPLADPYFGCQGGGVVELIKGVLDD